MTHDVSGGQRRRPGGSWDLRPAHTLTSVFLSCRRLHDEEKGHGCDYCGKHFPDSMRLRMHMLSHTGKQQLSHVQMHLFLLSAGPVHVHARPSPRSLSLSHLCLSPLKHAGSSPALPLLSDDIMSCRQAWVFCQCSEACVMARSQMCVQEHTVPKCRLNQT